MNIHKILDFLAEFRKTTKSSKNKKYAEKFIRVLDEIHHREIDELKRNRMNSELNLIYQNFELEKENINVKKELAKFLKFLKAEFSITIPWYFTYIGALIGLLSTFFFGFISLAIGVLTGGLIGYYFDDKAKKQGKKLNTELNEFIC